MAYSSLTLALPITPLFQSHPCKGLNWTSICCIRNWSSHWIMWQIKQVCLIPAEFTCGDKYLFALILRLLNFHHWSIPKLVFARKFRRPLIRHSIAEFSFALITSESVKEENDTAPSHLLRRRYFKKYSVVGQLKAGQKWYLSSTWTDSQDIESQWISRRHL